MHYTYASNDCIIRESEDLQLDAFWLFGSGIRESWWKYSPHRETYTDADAQSVCDWLNNRESWGPLAISGSSWVWCSPLDCEPIPFRLHLTKAGDYREFYSEQDWMHCKTELRSM